ncbi:LacI family DNA-binding transcriptional regulator, partial [Pseudomonas aeruginosa]|nr:LacI family DNA-binding transcriptional regulator [Pseudomonas aeruginosa]
ITLGADRQGYFEFVDNLPAYLKLYWGVVFIVAFSGPYMIFLGMQARLVLRAAEELGYQVNFLAQGLNRQRSHLIGVIVSRISDPFRSTLLDALLNEIQRQGF